VVEIESRSNRFALCEELFGEGGGGAMGLS
jgi:hypothetical protein